MLQKMGHTVVVAGNGKEAISLLATHRFDLILMDIQMPEMDGLSATRTIRESEKETRRRLPIIAMTAHAMKGDRERCIEAGMDGYVSKPISSQEVEVAIAGVIGPQGEPAPITGLKAKPAHTTPPEAPGRIVWNMGETLERLGGDEKLFHEVIEIFLDDVPKHMASLRRAIATGDAEAVEGAAHTLKGELGYLGISEVSQKARELEEFGRNSDLRFAPDLYAAMASEVSELLTSMRGMMGANPGVEMVAGRGPSE
jgi:CheY-like chemotaxis protein